MVPPALKKLNATAVAFKKEYKKREQVVKRLYI